MKLLAVAGDIGATITAIRLVQPLQALAADASRFTLRLRALHECSSADLAWADVLVLQRPTSERAWRLAQRMQAGGGTLVLDVDDLLTDPPAGLLDRDTLIAAQRWLRPTLAAADVVGVSTARLGRALEPFVRRWHEVPNYGQSGPAAGPAPRNGPWPTLLLASSDRVRLGPLADALRRVQERVPAPRVVAAGPVAHDLAQAGVRAEAAPPRPRADFLAWVQSLPEPVALVPLGDTAFDACKSAIKYFDLALCGIAVLASARPPYADVVQHDRTGLLVADDAADWQAALQRLRDEPALAAALAAAARQDVAGRFTLARSTAAWQTLLASVPPRRAPAVPPGRMARWVEGLAMRLRRINRARIQRRAAPPR